MLARLSGAFDIDKYKHVGGIECSMDGYLDEEAYIQCHSDGCGEDAVMLIKVELLQQPFCSYTYSVQHSGHHHMHKYANVHMCMYANE